MRCHFSKSLHSSLWSGDCCYTFALYCNLMSGHSPVPLTGSLLINLYWNSQEKTLAPCSTEKKTWQDVIDGTFLNNIFCGKEFPRNKTVPPCRWFVLHQFSWWGDAIKGDPVSIEAGDRWGVWNTFFTIVTTQWPHHHLILRPQIWQEKPKGYFHLKAFSGRKCFPINIVFTPSLHLSS